MFISFFTTVVVKLDDMCDGAIWVYLISNLWPEGAMYISGSLLSFLVSLSYESNFARLIRTF